jgi:hypothetical protein
VKGEYGVIDTLLKEITGLTLAYVNDWQTIHAIYVPLTIE